MQMLQQGQFEEGYEQVKAAIEKRKKEYSNNENYPNAEYDKLIQGLYLKKMGALDQSLKIFQEGQQLAMQSGGKQVLTSILMNIGQIFQLQNNSEKAISIYENAAKIAKEIQDVLYIDGLIILGEILKNQSNITKSMDYYNEGIQQGSSLLISMQNEYKELAQQLQKLEQSEKPKKLQTNPEYLKLSYQEKVLLGKLRKLQHSLAILYINQIDIYELQQNPEKALENLSNANHIYQGFSQQAKQQEKTFLDQPKQQQQKDHQQKLYLDQLKRYSNVMVASMDSLMGYLHYIQTQDLEYSLQQFQFAESNFYSNEENYQLQYIQHKINQLKFYNLVAQNNTPEQNQEKFGGELKDISQTLHQTLNKVFENEDNLQQQQSQEGEKIEDYYKIKGILLHQEALSLYHLGLAKELQPIYNQFEESIQQFQKIHPNHYLIKNVYEDYQKLGKKEQLDDSKLNEIANNLKQFESLQKN